MPIAFTLAFTEILKNVDDMREKARPKSQEFHKEEAKRRRRSDEDDRAGRIELEEVLKYELSPVPLSLFDSNGKMSTLSICWLQTNLGIDLLSPAQKLSPHRCKREWSCQEMT